METLERGIGDGRGLGDRLREIRLGRALTQEELAGSAGMTADAISRFETGKRTPRPPTVRRLAEALEVPVGELTGYKGPRSGDGAGER